MPKPEPDSENTILTILMKPVMLMVDKFLDAVVAMSPGAPTSPASFHAIAQSDEDVLILFCAYRVNEKHAPLLKSMALDHATRFEAELKFADESLTTRVRHNDFETPADADVTGAH